MTPSTNTGPIAWMARNPVAANLLMIVILVGGLVGALQVLVSGTLLVLLARTGRRLRAR